MFDIIVMLFSFMSLVTLGLIALGILGPIPKLNKKYEELVARNKELVIHNEDTRELFDAQASALEIFFEKNIGFKYKPRQKVVFLLNEKEHKGQIIKSKISISKSYRFRYEYVRDIYAEYNIKIVYDILPDKRDKIIEVEEHNIVGKVK